MERLCAWCDPEGKKQKEILEKNPDEIISHFICEFHARIMLEVDDEKENENSIDN